MLACYEWIHGVLDVCPALSCQFNVSDLSGKAVQLMQGLMFPLYWFILVDNLLMYICACIYFGFLGHKSCC